MRRIKLEFMGEKRVVFAEKVKGVLWFHINGQTYSYQKQGSRYGAVQSSDADPTKITAPMPGKITQVLCQKGEEVKTGQALMVMEAMKMEYTLEAKIDGKVAAVNAAVNDQVDSSQVLVQVEE